MEMGLVDRVVHDKGYLNSLLNNQPDGNRASNYGSVKGSNRGYKNIFSYRSQRDASESPPQSKKQSPSNQPKGQKGIDAVQSPNNLLMKSEIYIQKI